MSTPAIPISETPPSDAESLSAWMNGRLGTTPERAIVHWREIPSCTINESEVVQSEGFKAALDAVHPLSLNPDITYAFGTLAKIGPGECMNGWGTLYRDILLGI